MRDVVTGLRKWFGELADWMVTSKNGQDEAKMKNNHAVAYFLQLETLLLIVMAVMFYVYSRKP